LLRAPVKASISRTDWAVAITKRWQDTVWGIVEVGKLLIQAKKVSSIQRKM